MFFVSLSFCGLPLIGCVSLPFYEYVVLLCTEPVKRVVLSLLFIIFSFWFFCPHFPMVGGEQLAGWVFFVPFHLLVRLLVGQGRERQMPALGLADSTFLGRGWGLTGGFFIASSFYWFLIFCSPNFFFCVS